jgi:hypothetical protein
MVTFNDGNDMMYDMLLMIIVTVSIGTRYNAIAHCEELRWYVSQSLLLFNEGALGG